MARSSRCGQEQEELQDHRMLIIEVLKKKYETQENRNAKSWVDNGVII
jgi:hypothetical protein